MSVTITWLTVLALICVRLVFVARREGRYDRMEALQEFRTRFACQRREIIRLVHAKQLDPRSGTFHVTYALTSKFIRRSRFYPQLADQMLLRAVRENYQPTKPIHRKMMDESVRWDPDVRSLVKDVNATTFELMMRFSIVFRTLDAIDRHSGLLTVMRFVAKTYPKLRAVFAPDLGARETYREIDATN